MSDSVSEGDERLRQVLGVSLKPQPDVGSDHDAVAPLGERPGKITAVCGGETGDVVVDVVEVERDHLALQEGRCHSGIWRAISPEEGGGNEGRARCLVDCQVVVCCGVVRSDEARLGAVEETNGEEDEFGDAAHSLGNQHLWAADLDDGVVCGGANGACVLAAVAVDRAGAGEEVECELGASHEEVGATRLGQVFAGVFAVELSPVLNEVEPIERRESPPDLFSCES